METKDISRKVLSAIEEKHISPTPKWQFLLKAFLLWLSGAFSLLVGAAGFSVIIHLLRFNDWDAYRHINKNILSFTLLTLPYFWILFLALFIFIVDYNFKHTKRGYKYRLPIVAGGSIFLSMFLGTALYAAGVGRVIDFTLSDRLPFYNQFGNRRPMIWSEPENGRLAGMVSEIKTKEEFSLVDFQGQTWLVIAKDASVAPMISIEPDVMLRIIGGLTDGVSDNPVFQAKIILPAEHFGPRPKINRPHCRENSLGCPRAIPMPDMFRETMPERPLEKLR